MGSVPVVSYKVGTTSGISFNPPTGVNRAELAKAISEQLPAWVYWFIPTGYLGGNPFPLFLNQGKALFFVKPKEGDPTPVMPHVAVKMAEMKKSGNEATPPPVGVSGVMPVSGMAN